MKLLQGTPARVAAAGVLLLLVGAFSILPSSPARLESQGWTDLEARTIAGAYHIHSTRSDGTGDKAAIAAAAKRAGLRFVIVTDHGDGTRPLDPPVYIDGVLCLDGVEISTDEGHYVALDMRPSPYPLGGSAEAVVDDVRGLGGFGVAAHPDSAKASLRWTDTSSAIDAIEWLNGDSEWRMKSRSTLARAGLAYAMRPAPALATLLARPATLDRWDRLTANTRVVGLAGADAHGGIGTRAEDGTRSGIAGIPTYEAMFGTFSNRVVLGRRLTGDASADGRALLDAIRAGRVFSSIDALAGPALLDFRAEFDSTPAAFDAWKGGRVDMGDFGPRGRRVTLVARAQKPPGGELVLLHNGQEAGRSKTDTLRVATTNPGGAYRVEVHVSSAPGTPPIPWLVSNPIFFSPPAGGAPNHRIREGVTAAKPVSIVPASAWRIEKDPGSSAILRRSPAGYVELEYALKPGSRTDQYVALAADLPQAADFAAVRLRLSADRPTRVSVQLRRADGVRWGRSLYVDATPHDADEVVARLRPFDDRHPAPVDPATARSVLLVIDLANANPGRKGTIRLLSSELVK